MESRPIPTPAEDPALWYNRDGQVIRASVALILLPTIVVALRLVSRWKARAGYWWDDVSVVLAMVFSWGLSIVNLLASRTSLGHHVAVLTANDFVSFLKHDFAFQILYSLTMTCVKFSVVCFLYRIIPILFFRRVVIGFGAFVLAFGFSSTMVFIFECTPVQEFWHTPGVSQQLSGNCIQHQSWLLINGGMNTVTDFCLILLPLPLLWRLRASTLQRCVLTGIFITGLTVTAVSMVRLIVLAHYHGRDFTYELVPSLLWTSAEPSIAVVSACLPSLRPLFVYVFVIAAREPRDVQDDGFGSSNNLTYSQSSVSKVHGSSFRRLSDEGKTTADPWTNTVDIYGGKGAQSSEQGSVELGSRGTEMETPKNRIRAHTTITLTVSDRIDWQDRLY